MDTAWNAFILDCRDRYGVATPALAKTFGVPEATFFRRTRREGWIAPYPGVRIAPWVRPSRLTDLSALLQAAGPAAAAAGTTAAWLHGIRNEPPRRLEIAIPHQHRVPKGAQGVVRRHRWLHHDDRTTPQRLAVLTPTATMISLADLTPLELRAMLIDALHQGLLELAAMVARLGDVGPIRGRKLLAKLLFELADRRAESIFHDLVLDALTALGYAPGREPIVLTTPDGRGADLDVPMPQWHVGIDVQGDRFHHTRRQRAADRRRASQFAGTGWLVLQLDWWEWVADRRHFLEALDAAILIQVERGIVDPRSVPAHLTATATQRAQNRAVGAGPGRSDRVRAR